MAKHIECEIWEIQAELAEILFGFVSQDVASLTPEAGNGLANRDIRAGRIGVDVPGVFDLALSRCVDGVPCCALDSSVRQDPASQLVCRLLRGKGVAFHLSRC